MSVPDRKSTLGHWDQSWSGDVRIGLPSGLNVGVRNVMRLLREHVHEGDRYLEVGCAPGKMLAWVASRLGAKVTGIDYSANGIRQCERLFHGLGIAGDLLHRDFFQHGLPAESFDVVASFGFIEHFEDPRRVIDQHLALVRPGGTMLVTVPNYGGLYGRLQAWCNPENLAIHNIQIMRAEALAELVSGNSSCIVRAFAAGSMSPWLVDLDRRLPGSVARAVSLGVNVLGLMQPFAVEALCPQLVLAVRKSRPIDSAGLRDSASTGA